ncbi:WXG100 family type VII secretion target [Bacillus sp. MMSF_3353]|uniref:WXG100 family type VII secretion target n=1 Tax=Bacillus sp. MMSF_3353 TaxID=3047081 RepID=UPI00273DE67F|nr:WXG100 family type VII secretion target [Bacillus sp. MMSF_3353]
MVQIKVTPEMLEEVANRANNTRIALESIHNNLCNEIDQLCFQWIGASNQQFVQMFNDARPKAFTSINSIIQVEEDLKRIAEKFRNADNQDVTMEEGAMCGKPSSGEKGFDGGKLARDIAGEISGEYDIKRAWDGVDPSTGEKLSTWDRIFAGGMAVAGLTPVGKLAKVGKGLKMTTEAVEATKAVTSAKPNFVLFNKTHRDSMPKPKGRGPNGGNLQSHHGLQQQWAKENLGKYGYDPKLAPTVTIETGKGLPHTIISNAQNLRRDERLSSGNGKWSSTLQDELKNLVSDFEHAGFSKENISETLEQQYKMLDKLKVKYERIDY